MADKTPEEDEPAEEAPAADEGEGAKPAKKKAKKAARKTPAKKPAAEKKEEEAEEVAAEPFDAQRDTGPTVDMPPPGASSAKTTGTAALAATMHLLGLADFTLSILMIGLLAPLVLWLIYKDKDPELDYHGKESINFQLNVLFWSLVCTLLVVCVIGVVLLPVLSILEIVLIVIAAVSAANGERYRYPCIYRILQ